MARLTRAHEAGTGLRRPWKMTDPAPEYIDQMLAAIVGIEVEVTRMMGKWKLSRNKEGRDRLGAGEELRKRREAVISKALPE